MSTTQQYGVDGMTCGHCVAAVTEEIRALPGVERVDVELAAGATSTVVVTSAEPLDETSVRSAIDEAGYELISASAS